MLRKLNLIKKKATSFKSEQTAVSPVIGVILMVAITVVLATVVFILVQKIAAHQATEGAQLSLAQTRNGQTSVTYTVLSVSDSVNWSGLIVNNNGTAAGWTHTGGANVAAGDTITINGLTTNQYYTLTFVYANNVVAQMNYKS